MDIESGVAADASGAEPASRDDLRAVPRIRSGTTNRTGCVTSTTTTPTCSRCSRANYRQRFARAGIRPLALDRFGITLRVESGPVDDRDVRLPFAQPVSNPEALSRAIRVLIGCPFLNGLRQRTV